MSNIHEAIEAPPSGSFVALLLAGSKNLSNPTWNALKREIIAVHGPNIDWWEVRHQIDVFLASPFRQEMSVVEVFNQLYASEPLPFRKNNPDGSLTIKTMLQIAATFTVLSVIVITGYASILLVLCLATALILGGAAAVAGFFRR